MKPTIIDCSTGQKLHAAQWVPVADRLPDDDLVVLIHLPTYSEPVWLAWYDGERWIWCEGHPIADDMQPSHWMELPAPPGELTTDERG